MNGFDLSTVTDIRLGSTSVSAVYFGSNLKWPSGHHDYSRDYLTFEALDDFKFRWIQNVDPNSIYYSIDNGSTWIEMVDRPYTPIMKKKKKILIKSNLQANSPGRFTAQGRFNVMGNIMSLKYGDNFIGQTTLDIFQCFFGLFTWEKYARKK